jgi:large subunit ribosomal protein L3
MINLDYINNIEENEDLKNDSSEDVSAESAEVAPVEESKSEDTPVDGTAESTSVEGSKSENTSVEKSAETVHVEDSKREDSPVEESAEAGLTKESKLDDVSTEKVSGSVNDKKESKFVFTNLIGKKIGMTQLFSENGDVYPTTIIEAGPCSVTQIKTDKLDGYNSIQIGFSDIKNLNKINKSMSGHFKKSKSTPKKVLKEFRVDNDRNLPKLGDTVDVNQFNPGEFVSVSGCSIGKGFAGHMKRHGFGGGRASHGKNSVMRKSGSVGAGTSPGRIFPGMKMAGRMGADKVTVKNLQILDIDYNKNLIFIKGSVPGSSNNYVFLRKN